MPVVVLLRSHLLQLGSCMQVERAVWMAVLLVLSI